MKLATNNIKYHHSKTKKALMSLFNLFNRNKPVQATAGTESINDSIVNDTRTIDPTLFVDDQQPDLVSVPTKQDNHIQLFLNQNFDWVGYDDGYSHPETEYMNNRLKLIRADFRMAIDKTMELKRISMGDLKMHAIKTAGISQRLELQLNEKIKQLEIVIHELDMQKILAVENEGMIASAVHTYRLGFIKGLEKLQEEKFFAESTGLFNA